MEGGLGDLRLALIWCEPLVYWETRGITVPKLFFAANESDDPSLACSDFKLDDIDLSEAYEYRVK